MVPRSNQLNSSERMPLVPLQRKTRRSACEVQNPNKRIGQLSSQANFPRVVQLKFRGAKRPVLLFPFGRIPRVREEKEKILYGTYLVPKAPAETCLTSKESGLNEEPA